MVSAAASVRFTWLAAVAAVFVTVGGSATLMAVGPAAEGRGVPACAATASVAATDHGLSVLDGTVGRATKVWSLGRFVNDLRKPRPPRQRSERPTTGADGIEAMMTASMLRLMLCMDLHRPFLSDADTAGPLTGHYRSLLRPPSVLS